MSVIDGAVSSPFPSVGLLGRMSRANEPSGGNGSAATPVQASPSDCGQVYQAFVANPTFCGEGCEFTTELEVLSYVINVVADNPDKFSCSPYHVAAKVHNRGWILADKDGYLTVQPNLAYRQAH